MKNNYICALDLGTSKFACSLAKLSIRGVIESLYLESIPATGMSRGRIVDIQGVSASIDYLLKTIKSKSGVNVQQLSMNIYGQDVFTRHSKAIIPLAEKRNKLITPADVRRVTEEARILGSNFEEEIIQTIPFAYIVDDQDSVSNPVGLYGHKLGIDLMIISVKTAYLQGINRILNRLGYEVKHLFLSGLATSKTVLSEHVLKNDLYALCDIGADLTEIAIFEDAVLQHIETLPLGGNDLTKELTKVFKIPFDLAQEIKHSYGHIIDSSKIAADKEVMIKKDDYYKSIPQRQICEVITKQAKTICSAINDRLNAVIPKDECLNKTFVCGRSILIDGFLETIEETLGVPVKMAISARLPSVKRMATEITSSVPQVLNYTTALGVLYEALDLSKKRNVLNIAHHKNFFLQTVHRVKEIYQEYF